METDTVLDDVESRLREELFSAEQQVERLKRELELLAAFRQFRGKEPGLAAGSPSRNDSGEQAQTSHHFQLGRSLKNDVLTMVNSQPERKWTAPDIYNYLRSSGYRFSASSAATTKSSISSALGKLAQERRIKILKQGGGRRASVYAALGTDNVETENGQDSFGEGERKSQSEGDEGGDLPF